MKTIPIYKRVMAKKAKVPGKAFRTEYSFEPWMKDQEPWRLVYAPDDWSAGQCEGVVQPVLLDGLGNPRGISSIVLGIDPDVALGKVSVMKP